MRRITKRLLGMLAVSFSVQLAYMRFYPRPIYFEGMRSTQEAQAWLEKRYPKGSHLGVWLRDLKRSGASCRIGTEDLPKEPFPYPNCYFCHCINGIISTDPLHFFNITIHADEAGHIVEYAIAKHKGV
jgi:hypothetical protein